MAYPNFEKTFTLKTDASDTALGAVLSQIDDEIERPVPYASRGLSSSESNYIYMVGDALQHLHSKEILHNDLKSDNIVLERSKDIGLTPVIIDPGKACFVDQGKFLKLSNDDQLKHAKIHRHIAPEVVQGKHT